MNPKEERMLSANQLILTIANCGRRFFHYKEVSRLELDHRGRVWFIDGHTSHRIYTHYRYRWRGFSEGGTLKNLIQGLRDFITKGKLLHPAAFGPWPDWYCMGDLWGYGDDMIKVRADAQRLGIIPETPKAKEAS